MELFAGTTWDQYLRLMARDGTYGDHLTLQAAADVFLLYIPHSVHWLCRQFPP